MAGTVIAHSTEPVGVVFRLSDEQAIVAQSHRTEYAAFAGRPSAEIEIVSPTWAFWLDNEALGPTETVAPTEIVEPPPRIWATIACAPFERVGTVKPHRNVPDAEATPAHATPPEAH